MTRILPFLYPHPSPCTIFSTHQKQIPQVKPTLQLKIPNEDLRQERDVSLPGAVRRTVPPRGRGPTMRAVMEVSWLHARPRRFDSISCGCWMFFNLLIYSIVRQAGHVTGYSLQLVLVYVCNSRQEPSTARLLHLARDMAKYCTTAEVWTAWQI